MYALIGDNALIWHETLEDALASSSEYVVPWRIEDDTFTVVRSSAPAPVTSQAGLASIRGGIVATAPGHFPNCQGCNGECGV